jgi:hypothetical protein
MSDSRESPEVRQWRPFASRVLAGVGRRDITPEAGIRLCVWGAPDSPEIAEGVHQPLTVTALALSGPPGEPIFLVAVDLGWWRAIDDEQSVRLPVLSALDIREERLLLHLSHTHAGPCMSHADVARPGGDLVPEYLERVSSAIIEACHEALDQLTPCDVTWGSGSCQLAAVRDLPCGPTDIVGFNPAQLADDTLVVGRVCNAEGAVIATLMNYACHPTTLAWQNALLSPDFVGSAREMVESATGAPVIFLQGASGDLGPRDQFTGDLDVAERNGRVLGHATLAVLEGMPRPWRILQFAGVMESGAPLGLWEQVPGDASTEVSTQILRVPVPLQHLYSEDELRAKWAHLGENTANERVTRALMLRKGYVDGSEAHHPVWITHIGDAVIVAHPGEAYSLLQTELRRRHPDRSILVLNCTNGPGYMYVPDRAAYERLRYQAWQTLLGPGALEAVLEAADRAITQLPQVRGLQELGAQ